MAAVRAANASTAWASTSRACVDIKGTDLELRQYNGEIFIPLLVSSRGYGILWDNTSLSRFGGTEPPLSGRRSPGTATGRCRLDEDAQPAPVNTRLRTYSSGNIQVDVDYGGG